MGSLLYRTVLYSTSTGRVVQFSRLLEQQNTAVGIGASASTAGSWPACVTERNCLPEPAISFDVGFLLAPSPKET